MLREKRKYAVPLFPRGQRQQEEAEAKSIYLEAMPLKAAQENIGKIDMGRTKRRAWGGGHGKVSNMN